MKGLPKYKAIWNSGIAPNKNYLSYGLPSNKAVRTTNTETLRKKGNVARNSRMGGGRGAVTLLFSAAAPVLFGMVISNDATGSEGQRPDAMLAESLTTLTGEEPGSGAHKEAYFVWAKAGLHDSGLPLAYPKWWEASLYDAYERLYASQKYQSYVSENGLENLSLIDLIDDSGKIRPEYAPHINAIKKMLDAIKGGR